MGFLRSYPQRDLGDLIAEAQAASPDNQAAITEIVHRFEPLTRKIGRGLAARQAHRDDVENAARLALTHAVCRHQGAVETFPAYAKRYMTGAARRELSRWLSPPGWSLTDLDEAKSQDVMAIVPIEEQADHAAWGFGNTAEVITTLDDRRQRLLTRRYIDDADLATIAVEAGTSVSAISQRLSTIHRQLRPALAA